MRFDETPRPSSTIQLPVHAVQGNRVQRRSDAVATEEPMEIRLIAGSEQRTIAVTMRTPGHDFELAAGFLFSEGVIAHHNDVARISYCIDPWLDPEQHYNIVNVTLRSAALPDLTSLERYFSTTSACGVCGKASLESLQLRLHPAPAPFPGALVDAATLYQLPTRLRVAQSLFAATGGLHAAGLFDTHGELIALREDIGRHNAMDKLVGWALLEGKLPLDNAIVMVSGRASFELLQKSIAARIPIFCSVSAPSSLAADVARTFGITLVCFLRHDRFNVYTGFERLRLSS